MNTQANEFDCNDAILKIKYKLNTIRCCMTDIAEEFFEDQLVHKALYGAVWTIDDIEGALGKIESHMGEMNVRLRLKQ